MTPRLTLGQPIRLESEVIHGRVVTRAFLGGRELGSPSREAVSGLAALAAGQPLSREQASARPAPACTSAGPYDRFEIGGGQSGAVRRTVR